MACKERIEGFNCQNALQLIEDRDLNFFKVTQLAYFIGLAIHILVAPIFWFFNVEELFLLNLFFSIRSKKLTQTCPKFSFR